MSGVPAVVNVLNALLELALGRQGEARLSSDVSHRLVEDLDGASSSLIASTSVASCLILSTRSCADGASYTIVVPNMLQVAIVGVIKGHGV